ncbi:hypothetical protein Rs2_49790 [Raphanus sativus]|nr:hypothetical protein Rs2_49790 [Raphanus sativus]
MNNRFMELGVILEPGHPPKTDKAAILVDAVRMVTQLRGEAKKLKDTNSNLQDKIKDLKTVKNELRDEKQRLKTEKEKLEQHLKAMNAPPQPSYDAKNCFCFFSAWPSSWKQDGAIHQLPWSCHVAVHASCFCRYFSRSCPSSSSCLNWD